MASTYFIRVRGRVQGPFDDDKLRVLIRRGQFSRMHEVSTDGQSWSPAKDFPDLFTTPAAAASGVASSNPSDYQFQESAFATNHKAAGAAPPATNSSSAGDGWYFAIGDKQQGPVDFSTLSHLFSSGQISADSQVWREGMGNWTAARNVDALSPLWASKMAHSREIQFSTASNGDLSLSIVNAAASAKGWLIFIFLSGYVASALYLLGGIGILIMGAKLNAPLFVAQGLTTMIVAAVMLVGAILLSHYSANVSRFMVQRSEHALCDVFTSLARIWTNCGIILAFFYALMVLAILLGIAASQAAVPFRANAFE